MKQQDKKMPLSSKKEGCSCHGLHPKTPLEMQGVSDIKEDLACACSENSASAEAPLFGQNIGCSCCEDKISVQDDDALKLSPEVKIILSAILFGLLLLIKIDQPVLKAFLFFIPYILVGSEVVQNAFRNLLKGKMLDEQFLMTIASLGAFALQAFPEGVAVMLLYQIGEWFQERAVDQSKKDIESLLDIKADYAQVIRNGQEVRVTPQALQKNETIVIRPGEKVPVDGVILEGTTNLNTVALTGESQPVKKRKADKIYSGSINLNGVIQVKVLKTYQNSEVSRILNLVQYAQDKKAKAENFITKFARVYTPIVVGLALALALLGPVFSALYVKDLAQLALLGYWTAWIERALILLVISCPCALVISVPLSFFIGLGKASKNGILIKGANYIEVLAKLDTIVFDKTGTLTEGNFTVTAIHPETLSKPEMLALAAAIEKYSNHPIAESIVTYAKMQADTPSELDVSNVKELSGLGIQATIEGTRYFLGNERLMQKIDVGYKPCHLKGTMVHIATKNIYLGHITIGDRLKEDSQQALTALRQLGINQTIMLTGDSDVIAEDVAKQLSLTGYHAGLMPQDKVEKVEMYLEALHQKGEKTLAFVGDGLNDAAVLARADVGIAMGAMGSDAAVEAADVVIMDDHLDKLATGIQISRKTFLRVKENIGMSLGIKALILILGVLGIANMWLAIFADVGVLMIAVANAIRQ